MKRLFLVAAALAAFSWPVAAHQAPPTPERPYGWFYSNACCNNKDCRPAMEGEVTETPDGYLVTTPGYPPETVGYSDKRIKQSGDHHIHVCRPEWSSTVLCIYVPAMF